ncbi:MAG: hypothetical protein Q8M20_01995 [Rhodocyclaceae bacterium]|nr:hypothetical protein [Rhodocyclaceae bacterium]MDZ4216608.1 hypothetical protein [Rhodocyclaceae bacterium]
MLRTISIFGCIFLAFALNANAQEGNRVAQMEREIREIKLRLSKLESLLSNPGNAQESVTSHDGWKAVMNWRKLYKDMSTSDVQKILGEPHRVDGGNLVSWHYQNGGRVVFYEGKVDHWREPRK